MELKLSLDLGHGHWDDGRSLLKDREHEQGCCALALGDIGVCSWML